MAEFETRAIHTGLSFREETGAVIPPPWLTSTFAAGNAGGFDYTRSGNPSFRNLAETLASLEQARYATVFASGVSAITAVVSGLRHGDTVAAEENLYGCTFRLFEQVFRKFGLNVFYEDFTRDQALERVRREKPALVWIESPTNPMLKIIDIARTAEAARASGSCLIVDNTFASSYLQQPLRLGAHLSLLSTTKYTGGHSDVLGGAVCTDDPQQHERLEFAQKALGLQPSPFDCWMLSRGVKTEALRMERHCSNALAFARFLEEGTPARWVRYPFLPSHPQQSLARRQMRGGSGIVTADFGWTAEKTRAFLGRLKLFTLAESLGGIESLACHPATMTHASIPRERREAVGITDSLVRFSVGIEHEQDLRRDVEAALEEA